MLLTPGNYSPAAFDQAYLATMLGWCQYAKLDLSAWPNIGAYAGRVMSRPAVIETMKAEGLMG